jgi:catechol 2,3-dioxygenase-like lactoylglutathione lyase family enzyme
VSARLLAVTFEARDPARLERFWADLLGPDEPHRLGVRFVRSDTEKTGLNRMHLHLTSETPEHQRETVERALRLGASHLDVGQRPEEGHVVLADPEGNELCVIEPGNAYLAGCGFLGELACDGRRAVGLFWSEALGWPLVWDEGDETAIQSPHGGTKVAWSGDDARAKSTRQRFDLAVVGDLATEAERLVALGATRGGDGVLADPDGMEIRLVTG